MTIEYVKAVSRRTAERLISGPLRGDVHGFEGRTAWVGISLDRTSPALGVAGPRIVEAFGDDDSMHPEQAELLEFFVDGIARRSEPWALMVHCDAGLSRSAAVALWAFERYSTQPEERFEADHKHCFPNPHVLRLLKDRDRIRGVIQSPGMRLGDGSRARDFELVVEGNEEDGDG